VFDVLWAYGKDARALPIEARKALLEKIVPNDGIVRFMPHHTDDGRALFELCKRSGLEGVIAKRGGSPYRSGSRSPDWVKIKAEKSDEFVVFGYSRGEGGRGRLGALDIATYEDGELIVRGKVGSGLDERSIERLMKAMHEEPSPSAKGALERAPRGRVFVRPEIVVSVRYLGWTEEGRLRAPVFRGIRDDVQPEECTSRPR
jgi:bifunctional non-homologous end joining protein LigD